MMAMMHSIRPDNPQSYLCKFCDVHGNTTGSPSTYDKFNGTTAKWFKINQMGKKSDGNWYQQNVSAYHFPLLSSHTPYQYAKSC